MTVTGGAGDEPTRADREPPSFPSVGANSAAQEPPHSNSGAPLFAPASDSRAATDIAPVTTAPPDRPGRRGSRLRWLVAGIATLVVIAVVGGLLYVATPRAGAPSAIAHYVPADSAMYAEFRLDLPGDQRNNLASFMSHFPGFADQAAFQQKLDETLNTVLSNKTQGAVDWNNDVKPWFGGQVAIFGNPLPGMPTLDGTAPNYPNGPPPPELVIALTVTDKQKLQSVIDAHLGNSVVDSTDYNGVTITTVAQPAGISRSASYAITDDALLVAPDITRLKAALDVKAGQAAALADDTFFLQQLGALHADRLATVYFDASKQLAAMPMPSDSSLPADCTQMYQSAAGVKYVGEARAESDHLAFTIRSQVPSGANAPSAPQNRSTTLAQAMPSNTVAYVEARNVGANIGWLIKTWIACTSSSSGLGVPLPSGASGPGGLGNIGDASQMFEQVLGAKPEDYFDFIDDAGFGLTYAGDQVSGGVIATVNDQAIATSRVSQLVGLIKLAGGLGGSSTGSQITTSETDHNGVKVTSITVAGSVPVGQPVTLQLALANNRLYLGMNDFVTTALDRSVSDSLATNAKYESAIAAAPADNAGIVFVDVAQARDAIVAHMTPDERATYEADKKPFLDPFSSFSVVSHVDGSILVTDGSLFVE